MVGDDGERPVGQVGGGPVEPDDAVVAPEPGPLAPDEPAGGPDRLLACLLLGAIAGQEGEWLGFETLTLAPIDRNLIDLEMLRRQDRAWWNFYHARVWEALSPQLEGEALAWLDEQCRPLK